MSKIFILMFFPVLMTISGCLSAPTGLVKTDFTNWHVQNFKDLGLSIELPQQHYFSNKGYLIKEISKPKYTEKKGFKSIRVKMHPVYFGSVMVEPRYLLSVYITRLTENNFQNHIQGKSKLWMLGVFQENQEFYHDKLTTYTSETQKCCPERKEQSLILRKDYRASNGDYLLCGAKILAGSEEFIQPDKKDIEAVSRILNSVKASE